MQERELIRKHEGYREGVYYDTVGVPTGGYGHAFLPGSKLPKDTWEQIFLYDYNLAVSDYYYLDLDLDPVRRAVMVDMLFNLGLPKLLKFKNTLAAIRQGDYERAARAMLNSKWARQVKSRAKQLSEMMRTGEWPNG
jgi:lysozyme